MSKTRQHIIVKLQNVKDKKVMLTASREKKGHVKKTSTRLTPGLSATLDA